MARNLNKVVIRLKTIRPSFLGRIVVIIRRCVMLWIIAQIIGFVAVALYLLSYQLKKRKHIVLVTFISNSFYVLQYFLLGAFSGAVMDILSTIASFLAAKKNSLSFKKYAKTVGVLTVLVIIIIGLIIVKVQNNWIEFLPIGGAVFQVISLWCDDEQTLRKFGLCSAPFWLVYNFVSKAYGASLGSAFAIVSIIVSLIRYRKKKDV